MLPGDTVDAEIAEKLRSADLVLVLVSPSFIRSEYCWDVELKNAIERHERGEARVIPGVLRPCQWQLTPLMALLAMPTDGRAVINWPNRDTAYDNVARGIAKLAKTMRQKGINAADPAAAPGRSPRQPALQGPLPLTQTLSRARERVISPRLPEFLTLGRERASRRGCRNPSPALRAPSPAGRGMG